MKIIKEALRCAGHFVGRRSCFGGVVELRRGTTGGNTMQSLKDDTEEEDAEAARRAPVAKNMLLYKKYLLNRLTATPQFLSFLHTALVQDDEDMKHVFHKIMIHNWREDAASLFTFMGNYYSAQFIPVKFRADEEFCSFYVESLMLIQSIIKNEFIFPYQKNMFNVDVLFNDKTSEDFYGKRVTTEQLVTEIVSRRFTSKLELNLDNFLKDEDILERDICIYNLSQLAVYKRLMLRMGRDTRLLNLSNNNLSQVPIEVLNFFLRGELIGINLSNNNIDTITELQRIAKLEQLWLEGNPLCENEDPMTYVKAVTIKYPRLKELDGVPINQYGFVYPFWRNFLVTPGAKAITEKFLTLYFSHYDSSPRSKMMGFYDADNCLFSISTSLTDSELNEAKHFKSFTRNIASKNLTQPIKKLYDHSSINNIFRQLPETVHDPCTFTVDTTLYDRNQLLITVDGIFKERKEELSTSNLRVYKFRRTFYIKGSNGSFFIRNELLHVNSASEDDIKVSFNSPIRKFNELALLNPSLEEMRTIAAAFAHLTNLKNQEVEKRLKIHGWDIRKALTTFYDELKDNQLRSDIFVDENLEDLSDDDEID